MEDRQVAISAFAWLFNVSTSVAIVFINKVLMGRSGYFFNFGARPTVARCSIQETERQSVRQAREVMTYYCNMI